MLGHLHFGVDPGLADAGAAILLPMLLAGLLGGITHCAGMCGPFVFAQVGTRLGQVAVADFGPMTRITTAALVPYHLGRLTTYTALGAVAGGFADAVVALTRYEWLPAAFLLLAAALFLGQAVGRPVHVAVLDQALTHGASALARRLGPLFGDPRGFNGYLLGVALGFLPCGLLYGALAASAGCGTAVLGAAGMAAFAIGTIPALVGVGYGGVLLGQRRRTLVERLARPVMALNAVLLIALAIRLLA